MYKPMYKYLNIVFEFHLQNAMNFCSNLIYKKSYWSINKNFNFPIFFYSVVITSTGQWIDEICFHRKKWLYLIEHDSAEFNIDSNYV